MENLDIETIITTNHELTDEQIKEMQRIGKLSGASYVEVMKASPPDARELNYRVRILFAQAA